MSTKELNRTVELITKNQFKKVKITSINVENIPCPCSIGIDEKERKKGQTLIVDVSLDVDSTNSSQTDDIKDTVSYIDIYETVQKTAKSKPYSLIEYLGEELANNFLNYPLVLKAKIVVHKPYIPYPDFKGNVSVGVTREK